MNSLIAHVRDRVRHGTVLLHAAGAVGDTIHETARGEGWSLLVTPGSRWGDSQIVNGKGELLNV